MSIGLGELSNLSPVLLAAIALVVVAQLSLQIYSLIDLARRPASTLTWDKKWAWVLIIVFGELVGAIVYLVAGRKPPSATDPLRGTEGKDVSNRAAKAADTLYGKER